MRVIRFTLLSAITLCATGGSAFAAETADLFRDIKAVGREGQGNRAAQQALKQLTADDSVKLTTVLTAFDGASPLAENWLRGAFETLADRQLKATKKLPAAELEEFVLDTKQAQHRAHRCRRGNASWGPRYEARTLCSEAVRQRPQAEAEPRG